MPSGLQSLYYTQNSLQRLYPSNTVLTTQPGFPNVFGSGSHLLPASNLTQPIPYNFHCSTS